MKKLILLSTIVIAAVLCTACINNLAIQELNNKAQEYMKAGDVQSAICRLKSSLDLDSNFFETNYNLSVAYIEAKEWENAQIYLAKTLAINPNFPDAYYSLGYVYENLAYDIASKVEDANGNSDGDILITETEIQQKEVELSSEDKKQILTYYEKAKEAYNKFLSMSVDKAAQDDANKAIETIEREMSKYSDTETLDE